MRSWATEVEFLLPGGRRKVRPDGVWQAPEIGVPVLMVEVNRSTMAPADVAAKFPRYRELFRTRVRDNDPALADREPADRTVHWWRRTWPGHTRAGYPPVALVVTDAGPVALANRQQAVADLSADCWRGRWCREVRDYNDDGWREYDDAVPIVATTLELLAEHGPLGPVWWRFGRSGRHSLIEALENPNNRAAYDLRQAAREDEEHKAHQELMDSLVCIDCGDVPEQESTWEYGRQGQVEWTRRPGGRCWPCHQDREERLEREAEEQLEAARTANAVLYLDGLILPGGAARSGELPHEAAAHHLLAQTGLSRRLTHVLAVDYTPPTATWSASTSSSTVASPTAAPPAPASSPSVSWVGPWPPPRPPASPTPSPAVPSRSSSTVREPPEGRGSRSPNR
ncbi:hypothetical protein ACIG0C_35645 [Kitasatospora aureofaciens]|uniref:Uncharacterized protein n=2 Tax=Kitasatospora aureofaciens TaxID=1894 RepID=A0A1E7N1L2_KITAU|nr:hypothetical protein [Kitasatospora aureofaciens]OEV34590.1 hypothetical protein HS99_0008795 [Kitasatospora aureofaciens]